MSGGAATEQKPLADFIRMLARAGDDVVSASPEMLEQLRGGMQILISQDDWLDDKFAKPHPDRGQQYLLYADPLGRFSVVSVVWGPGHSTPIHDHTVWGIVGVLRGAEIEETFDLRDGTPTKTGEKRLEPGEVTIFSPDAGDTHRVRNAYGDRPTVSIHAYGGDIGAIDRRAYSTKGEVTPFRTPYPNRLVPNLFCAPRSQ